MYKKLNSFVYVFVVNCQFSPNNSVRACSIKLETDVLYHINNTLRKHRFLDICWCGFKYLLTNRRNEFPLKRYTRSKFCPYSEYLILKKRVTNIMTKFAIVVRYMEWCSSSASVLAVIGLACDSKGSRKSKKKKDTFSHFLTLCPPDLGQKLIQKF